LYKNKQAIATFEGYYGFVTGEVDGKVYFIASTEEGSSLFVVDTNTEAGKVTRVSDADNVIDARLMIKKFF